METVNRIAAVVTPKGPFFDWSKSVLGEEAIKYGPGEFRTVFLIAEQDDIDRALRVVFAGIFDEMLLASVSAPELWPENRDFKKFRRWFDVELVEIVFDAGQGDLLIDEP
jgi:hypothetical protein